MYVELHLHTCNLGTQTQESRNPFTGEIFAVPIDIGLNSAERSAVRALLADVEASAPDPDTYCRVVLGDGSALNVAVSNLFGDGPCRAFAVEYYSLTPAVASFVHDLASRGNLAIVASVKPLAVALPLPDQRERVASRWPSAYVVASPSDLEHWLRENAR